MSLLRPPGPILLLHLRLNIRRYIKLIEIIKVSFKSYFETNFYSFNEFFSG